MEFFLKIYLMFMGFLFLWDIYAHHTFADFTQTLRKTRLKYGDTRLPSRCQGGSPSRSTDNSRVPVHPEFKGSRDATKIRTSRSPSSTGRSLSQGSSGSGSQR